jgi:hypothetical protein
MRTVSVAASLGDRPAVAANLRFRSGASEQSGNPPPPAACSGPEYRQFSFWIGEWDVYEADGKPAGHNVIASANLTRCD